MKVVELFEDETEEQRESEAFMHRMLHRLLSKNGYGKYLLPMTDDDAVELKFPQTHGGGDGMHAIIMQYASSETPWIIAWHNLRTHRMVERTRMKTQQQILRQLQSWKDRDESQ